MSNNNQAASPALLPQGQVMRMATATWASKTLHAAAELGLADQLAGGPKSAAEIAGPMNAHAPSLRRLMRTLAGLGILTEQSEQRYALTTLGETLKTGALGSVRSQVLMGGSQLMRTMASLGILTELSEERYALTTLDETLKTGVPGSVRSQLLMGSRQWYQSAWDHIVQSVQTGKTGLELAQGAPLYGYLAQHPEDASLFNETMVNFNSHKPPAVAAAYDFSTFKTIVDVGGGTGNMLATILCRHTGPRGLLFDLPQAVADAPALLGAKGVNDRVTVEAGDFFKAVPAGGDAYVLSHVIHNWTEDQCFTILGHIRKAMSPHGHLLIVEMVLPPGDTPHLGKMLDMVMLVLTEGQERTEAEYGLLLKKAGFRLTRVVPTNSAVSVVEAVSA